MRILHTSLTLGFLTLLGFSGCTITTGVDNEGFGGDWWGEGGEGGEGGTAGNGGDAATDGGTASSEGGSSSSDGGTAAQGGAGGSTAVLYTSDMCADSASAAGDDDCLSCVYYNQCDPAAVDCENESGCMTTITAVLNCVRNVAAYNAVVLGDDPASGVATSDDIDNCTSGYYSTADLDAAYPDWDQYSADGLSIDSSDWVGAEISTDTEMSLFLELVGPSETDCRALCRLDEG